MELKAGQIQAGDHIKHGPSGENWFILGVWTPNGRVCVAGWPATMAQLSDCTLVKKGKGINLKERAYRNQTFGSAWDDERAK